MITRVNGFDYLLTDEWPPFGGEEAPNYPVRVGVPAAAGQYSRLKTWLRFIYGIPVIHPGDVQAVILGVCVHHRLVRDPVHGQAARRACSSRCEVASAYLSRAAGYFLLLTEDWPPFSYEEGGAAPGRADQQRSRESRELEHDPR